MDFDKDQLAADVDAAWHAYGDDKVQEMWEYHSYCLQATIDTNGGNLYEPHRSEEQCKASGRARGREQAPTGLVTREARLGGLRRGAGR